MNDKDHQLDGITLDPENWNDLRALGHRMLDDMIDYIEHIRERPVWQPIPQDARARFDVSLPHRVFVPRGRL